MHLKDLLNENDSIFTYTRARAIEDGVLIDISKIADESGINYPVAVTAAVWNKYIVPDESTRAFGQCEEARIYDLLWMFITHARGHEGSQVNFKCLFMISEEESIRADLKSVCGPGDDKQPVITIMLPYEN